MEISKDLASKAKECKTPEELLAFAKRNGIELDEEAAKEFFEFNSEGELEDSELESVSGGKACKRNAYERVAFDSEAEVQFIFNVGDVVQAFSYSTWGSTTATVKITERKVIEFGIKWTDGYKVEKISGTFHPGNPYKHGCHFRNRFEK